MAPRYHGERVDREWQNLRTGYVEGQRSAFNEALVDQSPQAPVNEISRALDSGARKGELCGLQWGDLDLEQGTVTFVRQLIETGDEPVFGPIKNDMPRTVDRSAETVTLLREHKRHQAQLKMANRTIAVREMEELQIATAVTAISRSC